MLRKLRTGQIMDILLLVLILSAIDIVIFWRTFPSIISMIKGVTPLTAEMDLAEMEGSYVSWEVKYPLGEYMETTKTTKVNDISIGTKKNRSSWIVLNEDQGICVSIEVPVKRYDEMEAQSNRFFQSIAQEEEMTEGSVSISGTLEVLKGEELRYFKQAAKSVDLPVEATVYHIRDGIILGESKGSIYGAVLVGGLLLLMALCILGKTLKNSPKKLIRQYLGQHPEVTMEQLESDFSSASEVNWVWVGRNWTFSPKMQELILENRQVVWVHSSTVHTKRNVSFYVLWYLIDGSVRKASLSSEKKCKQVMEKYNQFSHILVGNNPEYGYLLKNDQEAFLNLKYRNNQG